MGGNDYQGLKNFLPMYKFFIKSINYLYNDVYKLHHGEDGPGGHPMTPGARGAIRHPAS